MNRPFRLSLWFAQALLLSACAAPPPASVNYPPPTVSASAPVPTVGTRPSVAVPSLAPSASLAAASPATDSAAADRALSAAIGAYDRGDYGLASRLLTPLVNDGSLDPEQQLRALKTLAFSQCSINALTLCRGTFERAFRADPRFDLAPAERGHPIWGPQFERARRVVLGK